jgi:hypothetical protein
MAHKRQDDLSNLLGVIFDVIRKLADHRSKELCQRWYQVFHVLAPVILVAQARGGECFVKRIILLRASNEQGIDLEGVSHQFKFIFLNNEVEGW